MTNKANKADPLPPAGGGQVERPVRPRAWMTRESALRMQGGGNAKGAVPVHGKRSSAAVIPLYDQAALDAALSLWPRDCRLCVNYTTALGGCMSTVRCVDSDQYSATAPHQYWLPGPNDKGNRPA